MPNIQQILNGEIRRLARKEIKAAIASLQESNSALKNRISILEKKVKSLEKATPAAIVPDGKEAPDNTEKKFRFTPARIKQLREKLGVSQRVFAELAQVTVSTVNNWEHGKTKPQQEQKKNLAALRGLGKRELAKKIKARNAAQEEKAPAPETQA